MRCDGRWVIWGRGHGGWIGEGLRGNWQGQSSAQRDPMTTTDLIRAILPRRSRVLGDKRFDDTHRPIRGEVFHPGGVVWVEVEDSHRDWDADVLQDTDLQGLVAGLKKRKCLAGIQRLDLLRLRARVQGPKGDNEHIRDGSGAESG